MVCIDELNKFKIKLLVKYSLVVQQVCTYTKCDIFCQCR